MVIKVNSELPCTFKLHNEPVLRLLFIVFFVPICIDDYIFSVHRKTKLFGGMEGP